MSQELSDNDHRVIGQKLDLFSFHEVAPGAPFWHPKGMMIFRVLEEYIREVTDKAGYEEISTPIMVKKEVFEKSGHWQHFKENMFWFKNHRDENETLILKPMNCPESTYVYNSTIRSYRDLPLRLAEIGRLHRNELSGTLGGLMRVRQITMDDAHIFVKPEDTETEIINSQKMINNFYELFGFKISYEIATRPDKALGEKKQWDEAESALKSAMDKCGQPYTIAEGEGAFYGPKIEVHIKDNQGRDWQMGTTQLDLVMLPEQFKLEYTAEDGSKKTPWVIHRAILGSFERFIGILLEHTNGALPYWLSPIQVRVITINERVKEYADGVVGELKSKNIRAWLDDRNETINKKIREGEMQKIPYLMVLGDKEMNDKAVSVRFRETKETHTGPLSEFFDNLPKK
jgi:threonyl-tRNA synthetase